MKHILCVKCYMKFILEIYYLAYFFIKQDIFMSILTEVYIIYRKTHYIYLCIYYIYLCYTIYTIYTKYLNIECI